MSPEAIRVWAERVPSEEDRAVLLVAAPPVERMYDTQGKLRHAMFEQERVRQLIDTMPKFSAAPDRFPRGLLDLEERIPAAEATDEVAERTAERLRMRCSPLDGRMTKPRSVWTRVQRSLGTIGNPSEAHDRP